jgi:predicted dithiol-disulfide oxidoreductase (DUF899 family)
MILGWEQFAADLAAAHGEEFVRDFCRTLTDEQRAEEEITFAAQRQIASATERLENCFIDGLGELHMRVDAEVFFHWIKKEGREIWNDPQFIHEFKRDNPDVRVLSGSRKTMVRRP